MANYRASYSAQEKRIFAEKLRKLMLDRGIGGAELARLASKHRPSPMARQAISAYLNGSSIPDEANLRALEKALDAQKDFLLPRPHKLAPGETDMTPGSTAQDMRMRVIEGGMMELSFSGTVPREIGWEIMQLLEKAGH